MAQIGMGVTQTEGLKAITPDMDAQVNRQKKRHRFALLAGGIFGGALSVFVTLMMDFMASDELKGTWRDAIVSDLSRYLSINISPDSVTAYLLFLVVLLLLTAAGAALGALFAWLVFRFLELLTS